MKNEYDLWFQERKAEVLIKIPACVCVQKGGEVLRQAVAEFYRGVQRLTNISLAQPVDLQSCGQRENAVFLGTVSALDSDFDFKEKPSAEGFIIFVKDGVIVIAGADEAGLLYGVFRFIFLLTLGDIHEGFELCDSPVSPLRMINHWDNFDGSVERGYAGASLFYRDGKFNFDSKRIEDYARALASTGINRISINNVNVRAQAKLLITEEYLQDASRLAAIFRRFGIRVLLSINFGAPWSLGKLPTADPLDPQVAHWWKEHAKLIYKYIPDLAGFLVKADSEGEPGPFQYKRTHSDGANMLAKAVKPYGGVIVWRCFVYNCTQDWRDKTVDRARAAYDHFMPQDGMFDDNVILQIKHGPYDFQVREPVNPLFGVLKKTRHVMELQITQEYTGQQIDLAFLPWMWEDLMNFSVTGEAGGEIKNFIGPEKEGTYNIEGFSAVGNVGQDINWCGHTLAQSNLYGYARIAWNPAISARQIAYEWSSLSFEKNSAQKVTKILLSSYPVYEKYTVPFGICFMVNPGYHYGPSVEGYEFSRWGTYHRADTHAIGIDRTGAGTGYVNQYPEKIAAMFADPKTCPQNVLLFFHRLCYDFIMKNGQTLLQNIYDTHFEGYDEAAAMLEEWKTMKDELESEVYVSVLSRFERQLANAREWRDQINTYFLRRTGIKDQKGRIIYE
jgi:alpha-glucuronidase